MLTYLKPFVLNKIHKNMELYTIPNIPSSEEISRNYYKWKIYSDKLALAIKETKPLYDRIYYTKILKDLFDKYIGREYSREIFDPSKVKGTSIDNGNNSKSDNWSYNSSKVSIHHYGRITTRLDDLDYFIDESILYDGNTIYNRRN